MSTLQKTLDQMIDDLIGREGSYTFNINDAGGETNWGVTVVTARRNGYSGAMSLMPRATAATIYRNEYLVRPGFDQVYTVSQRVAEVMFDTGVNMGTNLPGTWLQRILNSLNRQGKDYPDIGVDGHMGPATVGALRACLAKRGADGETVIVRALNCQRGVRYLEITEARPQNEDFYFGWLLNRVEIA
jgi:lysozyme family protein